MTNVLQLHRRTLTRVLCDIAEAEARWSHHWNDDSESQLLDRIDALRDEGRAMVADMCGVSWASLERGLS